MMSSPWTASTGSPPSPCEMVTRTWVAPASAAATPSPGRFPSKTNALDALGPQLRRLLGAPHRAADPRGLAAHRRGRRRARYSRGRRRRGGVPASCRLPLRRRGQELDRPPGFRIGDQRREPPLPRLFLLRAHHPPDRRVPIGSRLRLEPGPGRLCWRGSAPRRRDRGRHGGSRTNSASGVSGRAAHRRRARPAPSCLRPSVPRSAGC